MKRRIAKQKRWTSQAEADARMRLRIFKNFLARQDPERLALLASDIERTLVAVAAVDLWFREYVDTLKKRRRPR